MPFVVKLSRRSRIRVEEFYHEAHEEHEGFRFTFAQGASGTKWDKLLPNVLACELGARLWVLMMARMTHA